MYRFLTPKLPIQKSRCIYPTTVWHYNMIIPKEYLKLNLQYPQTPPHTKIPRSLAAFPGWMNSTIHMVTQARNTGVTWVPSSPCSILSCPTRPDYFTPLSLSQIHPLLTSPHHPEPTVRLLCLYFLYTPYDSFICLLVIYLLLGRLQAPWGQR